MPVLPASDATLLLKEEAVMSLLLTPAVILQSLNILKQDFLLEERMKYGFEFLYSIIFND